VFDTIANNETLVSECSQGPPVNETPTTVALPFQYSLLVTAGADPGAVVGPIEALLHQRLGGQFLTCLYTGTSQRRLQDASLEFTKLSSGPADTVSTEQSCSQSEEAAGADCYVVDAGFTPSYLTDGSNVFVVNTIAAFLNGIMQDGSLNDAHPDIQGLSFRGFTDVNLGSGDVTPDDRGGTITGANQQTNLDGENRTMIAGFSAIAVAATGVVIVVLLVVRKRRTQREVYQKHIMEDASLYSIEGPTTTKVSSGEKNREPRSVIVNEESEDDEVYLEDEVVHNVDDEWEHDPETCHSATCPICQETRQPTFVRAADMENGSQVQSPSHAPSPPTRREYFSPDTIDL